ncbi:hypothetical protein O181_034492 [Austropuccinia psidii MF-1]|uniref:Uncharacterized protein n=1 Tax=Austropuccinia psidii MF-1 TaxID=1389203 RepID=A0A9Q3D6Q2_9BASI|nr:hypothetical protein [Austropuccinia psidii MF-1]
MKTTHLKSLPTISHHYELLPLNPTMQQEYSTLCKEVLSSKSKGPGEVFRNIDKLKICCNHHIMLNTIAHADLEAMRAGALRITPQQSHEHLWMWKHA